MRVISFSCAKTMCIYIHINLLIYKKFYKVFKHIENKLLLFRHLKFFILLNSYICIHREICYLTEYIKYIKSLSSVVDRFLKPHPFSSPGRRSCINYPSPLDMEGTCSLLITNGIRWNFGILSLWLCHKRDVRFCFPSTHGELLLLALKKQTAML